MYNGDSTWKREIIRILVKYIRIGYFVPMNTNSYLKNVCMYELFRYRQIKNSNKLSKWHATCNKLSINGFNLVFITLGITSSCYQNKKTCTYLLIFVKYRRNS